MTASAKPGADLSPGPFGKLRAGERGREMASILAAGILGFRTRATGLSPLNQPRPKPAPLLLAAS